MLCRHELFKEYKAQRPPFPQEIKVAIPQLTALLKALRIPLIREPGVEADDVIGTLALRAVDEGFQVAIVSPDKVKPLPVPGTSPTPTGHQRELQSACFEMPPIGQNPSVLLSRNDW